VVYRSHDKSIDDNEYDIHPHAFEEIKDGMCGVFDQHKSLL